MKKRKLTTVVTALFFVIVSANTVTKANAKIVDISGIAMGVELDIVPSPSKTFRIDSDVKLQEEDKNGTIILTLVNKDKVIQGNAITIIDHNIINMAVGDGAVSELTLPGRSTVTNGKRPKITLYIPSDYQLYSSRFFGKGNITAPLRDINLTGINGELRLLKPTKATLKLTGAGSVDVIEPTGQLNIEAEGASEIRVKSANLSTLTIVASNAAEVAVSGKIDSVSAEASGASDVMLPVIKNIKKNQVDDAATIRMKS